jgi:hypothetical protein
VVTAKASEKAESYWNERQANRLAVMGAIEGVGIGDFAHVEIGPPPVHTKPMNDITRHELDAKLEVIEARMDGRVASIEAKIDGFLSAQAERDKRLDGELEASRRESRQIFQTLSRDIDRLGSIKANIWGAMVTTIVILVAVGALALTAFQAGAVKQPLSVEAAQPTDSAAPALAAPAK